MKMSCVKTVVTRGGSTFHSEPQIEDRTKEEITEVNRVLMEGDLEDDVSIIEADTLHVIIIPRSSVDFIRIVIEEVK